MPVAQASRLCTVIPQGIEQVKMKHRQKIYKQLVERTTGIWKKGDGLAYQEKLRAEWEQRLRDYTFVEGKR